MWWTRLRWRLRGATMWPTFVLALVVDALLLHLLPIAGDRGPGLFPALLLAGFFNLVVVAVGAPLAGRWVRRRRPSLPKVVADDRAGTVLLGATAVVLLAIGLAHRPAIQDQERDFARQAASARRFVLGEARGPSSAPTSTPWTRSSRAPTCTAPASRVPTRGGRSACSSPPTRTRPASRATPTSAPTPRSAARTTRAARRV